MVADRNEKRLAEILAGCMEELFAEQRMRASRMQGDYQPPVWDERLAAFSGFENAAIRGSVILVGSLPLFSRTHPLPTDAVARDLADWACELVNQAVGRFRNRLLAYDVSLTIGGPQSSLAQNPRLRQSLRRDTKPMCFVIDDDVLEVWLELAISPDFRLAERPTHERPVALKEGSALFF